MLTPNVDSFATQRVPHLTDSVDAVIVSMNLADVLNEGGVAKTTVTQPARLETQLSTARWCRAALDSLDAAWPSM